jgi:hypothetical protein
MEEQSDIDNSAAVTRGNKSANEKNKKIIKIRGSYWILPRQAETDQRRERKRTTIDPVREKQNTRFCPQRCVCNEEKY